MATQSGVISRRQALDCGLSNHQIRSQISKGLWLPMAAGVYRAAATPRTYKGLMVTACLLSPWAVFSHYTAARFHELDVRPDSPLVWVTVPRGKGRMRLSDLRVSESRTVTEHVVANGGWRFTTVPRTLADLGQFLPAWKLERVVYAAVQKEKVTLPALQEAWRSVAERSVRNSFFAVLESFNGVFDSGLELDAARIFSRHGIPLQRQVEVWDRGRVIRRFDFADPELKIAVEIDGIAHHSSLAAQQRDRARDRLLAGLGWVTIRFSTADVRRNPGQMVRIIKEVRDRRREEMKKLPEGNAG